MHFFITSILVYVADTLTANELVVARIARVLLCLPVKRCDAKLERSRIDRGSSIVDKAFPKLAFRPLNERRIGMRMCRNNEHAVTEEVAYGQHLPEAGACKLIEWLRERRLESTNESLKCVYHTTRIHRQICALIVAHADDGVVAFSHPTRDKADARPAIIAGSNGELAFVSIAGDYWRGENLKITTLHKITLNLLQLNNRN